MADHVAPYRVLIVDDVPAVREALQWAFEAEPDLLIVGEAGDGPEAIMRARDLGLDVVILDIELPRLDGYEVAHALKAMSEPPIVILLSVHSDTRSRERGAAIADGFVEKSAGWAALVREVRRTLAGRM